MQAVRVSGRRLVGLSGKQGVKFALRGAGCVLRPVQCSSSGTAQPRNISTTNVSYSDSDFMPKRKEVPTSDDDVQQMIKDQVTEHPIMLYMKGTPSAPQCGFSMQVVQILKMYGVDFASVNVMDHPTIREGIKKFSDWPTIPQVYVKGEFVGGCDIVTSMHKSGELEKKFTELGIKSEPTVRK